MTAQVELRSTWTRLHCGHVGPPGAVVAVTCRRDRRSRVDSWLYVVSPVLQTLLQTSLSPAGRRVWCDSIWGCGWCGLWSERKDDPPYVVHWVGLCKEYVVEGGCGHANYVSNPTKLSMKKQKVFSGVDATNFVSNDVPAPNSNNTLQAAHMKGQLVCASDKGSMTHSRIVEWTHRWLCRIQFWLLLQDYDLRTRGVMW